MVKIGAAALGLVLAFVFGMLAVGEVLTMQATGEAVGGNIGTFFESVGPLFLIIVATVVGIGAIMTVASIIRKG